MTLDAPLVTRLLKDDLAQDLRRLIPDFDRECVEIAKLYGLTEHATPLFQPQTQEAS